MLRSKQQTCNCLFSTVFTLPWEFYLAITCWWTWRCIFKFSVVCKMHPCFQTWYMQAHSCCCNAFLMSNFLKLLMRCNAVFQTFQGKWAIYIMALWLCNLFHPLTSVHFARTTSIYAMNSRFTGTWPWERAHQYDSTSNQCLTTFPSPSCMVHFTSGLMQYNQSHRKIDLRVVRGLRV